MKSSEGVAYIIIFDSQFDPAKVCKFLEDLKIGFTEVLVINIIKYKLGVKN